MDDHLCLAGSDRDCRADVVPPSLLPEGESGAPSGRPLWIRILVVVTLQQQQRAVESCAKRGRGVVPCYSQSFLNALASLDQPKACG